MGDGDVTLAVLMGVLLGGRDTLVAMVLAFNLAALVGIVMILGGKASRKSLLPFGPFLIFGTLVAYLYGEPIAHAYLKLLNAS